MTLSLYIAKRLYHNQDDKRKVSRPAINIASIGVAIGLAVMIITISVIMGFKNTIQDKVIGFGSHIQIINSQSLQDINQSPIVIDDSIHNIIKNINGVKHIETYSITSGILKSDNDFIGITFKGVGPDYNTEFLQSNLKDGEIPNFNDTISLNQIVISQNTANKLHLAINDKVYAYFISSSTPKVRRFTIKGIYKTNLSQFDESICFTDKYTINKLNKWEENHCTGVEIIACDLKNLDNLNDKFLTTINKTKDKEGNLLRTTTIHETYPQIFTWLKLLDLNVWIILGLMLCVAGFTMISGLLIIILERIRMIGILKALGTSDRIIRHTFMWFATFIIFRGLILGNLIGVSIILIQKHTGLIQLDPANYYVSTAPMELNIISIIILNITTLFICIFVLILPSFIVSHINPIKTIRYE